MWDDDRDALQDDLVHLLEAGFILHLIVVLLAALALTASLLLLLAGAVLRGLGARVWQLARWAHGRVDPSGAGRGTPAAGVGLAQWPARATDGRRVIA